MPRATKDTKNEEISAKVTKAEQKKVTKTTKSKSPAKKAVTKTANKADETKKKTTTTSKSDKTEKVSKSPVAKKEEKVAKKNSSTTKKTSKTEKKKTKTNKTTASVKEVKDVAHKEKKASASSKKATTKKSTTTKKAATKKSTTKKNTTKSTSSTRKKTPVSKAKKVESNIVAEYYDLPYRYNETIVKILYQTPNVLFVYWDISDDDRNKFINEYGEYFFNDTKPVLKIFNLTKNYNFEVEINDFANSWYINVADANCDYKVELGRKPIFINEKINTDYIYVSSSNSIEFPNDHILLEKLPSLVNFKNVKTNKITTKKISTLRIVGINKIYSIYDFYKKLYKDDILEEINNNKIINPSSTSSWSN